MKRFVTLALVSALVLGASSIVYANVCAFDAVPAATILFPFVSLDYNNPLAGTSTTFSITNVSAEAQIVHVTVWSDISAAVLDFNILLTGYDVISMNIRDILINGKLPVTLNEIHSGDEGVAVNGPVSSGNNLNGGWLNPGIDPPQPTSDLGNDCLDSPAVRPPTRPTRANTPRRFRRASSASSRVISRSARPSTVSRATTVTSPAASTILTRSPRPRSGPLAT